jgi:2,3-diketo-5-methylthio-1-phosphopentane phosphatase
MKILCDFDGTAAADDVGNLLFRKFAGDGCFDIIQLWKDGRISSKECILRECQLAEVTESELASFCDRQKLAPHFEEFLEYCQESDIPVDIVSDGLDFYVNQILSKHGLNEVVDFYTNKLHFLENARITAEFPYFDYGCGSCANCKGYHVKKAKSAGYRVVYIGDGLSDRCGAAAADIVFAKKGRDLEHYCDEQRLPHYKFNDFKDVLQKLKTVSQETSQMS